ncbi:MAG: protein-L-isoaspartate O-methyltransferase [Methylophilales bacterium RIFCSPHIGHO2_02_FULL_57_10]|nr:MAG: protein-L-isoaspartate O-methyltransferase [Methylophilales bacterium RIFCSPHIGHO2_02_FULL_57_10]
MLRILVIVCVIILQPYARAAEPERFAAERRALMAEISALARETQAETGQGAFSVRVMEAMGKVPRHRFVPPEVERYAYRNRPLPIGYGQTISQPFLVAYMTELLQVNKDSKVLEIGTGSGYQAAILGELVSEVYTIEIVKPLAVRAAETLKINGYSNVQVRVGDGYYGWEKHAPFDAIIVTAAAGHVPPPLIQQLKRGGRMLIPLGSSFMPQQLVLVEKDMQDRVRTRELLSVQFVPLTGGH